MKIKMRETMTCECFRNVLMNPECPDLGFEAEEAYLTFQPGDEVELDDNMVIRPIKNYFFTKPIPADAVEEIPEETDIFTEEVNKLHQLDSECYQAGIKKIKTSEGLNDFNAEGMSFDEALDMLMAKSTAAFQAITNNVRMNFAYDRANLRVLSNLA